MYMVEEERKGRLTCVEFGGGELVIVNVIGVSLIFILHPQTTRAMDKKIFRDLLLIQTRLMSNFYKTRSAFPESSQARIAHRLSVRVHISTKTPFNVRSNFIPRLVRNCNLNSRPSCTRLFNSSCISELMTSSDVLVMLTDLS